jgi:hypothetical protein
VPRVKAKKRCCKSDPRCKRCPVVLRRLERAGLADRVSKREWRIDKKIPKQALKAARG